MKTRQLDLHTFDELRTEILSLSTRPYQRAGQWSLGQNCQHLAKILNQSIDGFDIRLPWFIRIFSGFIKNRVLKNRCFPKGVQAPKPFLPDKQADDEQGVSELLKAIQRYQHHTGPLQPSPLFGRLSREEWDQLHLIHASHHLGFILPIDSSKEGENPING